MASFTRAIAADAPNGDKPPADVVKDIEEVHQADHAMIVKAVHRYLGEVDSMFDGRSLEGMYDLDRYITLRKEFARQHSTTNGITDDNALWGEIVLHLTTRFNRLAGSDNDDTSKQLQKFILRFLSQDSHDPASKNFLLRALEAGPDDLRMQIIWGMRGKKGLHGRDVYAKVKDLCDKGIIPEKYRTVALSNADPEAALPELLRTLETTRDIRVFVNTARIYEWNYHSIEHFDVIVRRTKELELDKPFEGHRNALSWLDPTLLAKFVDVAKGDDLRNALDVMGMGGRVDPSTPSIMPIIKCLSHSDPGIRQRAAQRLAYIASSALADHDLIVSALDVTAAKEVDAPTRAVMLRSLDLAKSARGLVNEDRRRHSLGVPTHR